jgi:hypothetical protein
MLVNERTQYIRMNQNSIESSISAKFQQICNNERERLGESKLPPMDQPLQIRNFCRLDDTAVYDAQQIKGTIQKLK